MKPRNTPKAQPRRRMAKRAAIRIQRELAALHDEADELYENIKQFLKRLKK